MSTGSHHQGPALLRAAKNINDFARGTVSNGRDELVYGRDTDENFMPAPGVEVCLLVASAPVRVIGASVARRMNGLHPCF